MAGQTKEQRRKKLLKELIEDEYTQRVIKNLNRLFDSQLALAVGIVELYKKRTYGKTKANSIRKTEPVTEQDEIIAYLDQDKEKLKELNGGDETTYHFISVKKPDNKAIMAMLNRAFGKPSESLDLTTQGEKIDGFKYVTPKKPALKIEN